MPLVIGEEPIHRLQLELQPGRVPWDPSEMQACIDSGSSPAFPQSRLRIGNFETVYMVGNGPYLGSLGVYLHTEYEIFGQEHTQQEESETIPKFFIFGGWQICLNKTYFVPSEPWPTQGANGEKVKHAHLAEHFVNPILTRINMYTYIYTRIEDEERVDTLAYPPFWLAITDNAKHSALFNPDFDKQHLAMEAAEVELTEDMDPPSDST